MCTVLDKRHDDDGGRRDDDDGGRRDGVNSMPDNDDKGTDAFGCPRPLEQVVAVAITSTDSSSRPLSS